MSTGPPPPADGSPAERRLDEHLKLLRSDALAPSRALVPRVVRTARWQRLVRAPLRVMGVIAAAVFDAVAGLTGPRRRGGAR